MLKKRLEEVNKSLQADPLLRAEEIKKLRRVVRDKESACLSYCLKFGPLLNLMI